MTTDISDPDRLGDLNISLRHQYTVTRKWVGDFSIELKVYADGKIIGHQITSCPQVYAQVCRRHQADGIDTLRQLIPKLQKEANLCEGIQQRDLAALAEDARRRGCQNDPQAPYLTYRENAIRQGAFGQSAEQAREEVARRIKELYRLLAGPVQDFNRLFVRSWHRSQSQAHRVPRWAMLVDVLDIPTDAP